MGFRVQEGLKLSSKDRKLRKLNYLLALKEAW